MNAIKALVIKTETVITPFNDHCGDILISNEKLRDYQLSTLSDMGFSVEFISIDSISSHVSPGTLILYDYLYFTPEFLAEFISKASNSDAEICSAAVKKGLFTKQIAIFQDFYENESILGFPLYYCAAKKFEPEKAKRIVIDVEEFYESGNFPQHMIGKDNFKFCLTTRAIMAVRESIHIALANMASNFARIARYKKLGLKDKLSILWRARSIDKFKILSSISVIEKGAEVHPTAVVEGSVIKSGAKIGAYAVIKFSVIGSGAYIDDHSAVKFSVIGDGAYIANNNVIFFCVVYPRAFLISGPYQFTCFGYDSAIMNSIPSDYRLDGKTIQVMTSKGIRDTGLRFAGSIIGHRTRIAAGLIIAPGREIPNNITLYPDPAMVLTRIDRAAVERSKTLFLINGRLVDKI